MPPKIALLILALVSGETRDNSAKQGTVKLAVGVHSSSSSFGFGEGSSVRIDAVWLTMRDLRFVVSCKGGAATFAIPGPITAELVAGKSVGLPESLKLDAGRYCAFDLGFRAVRGNTDGAPRDLRGVSVLVQGRRGDGVRFVVRCRLDTSPRLSAAEIEGFAISEGTTQMLLSVDVARWFAGLELSTAEISGEARSQEIRIDDNRNTDLLAGFRANVEAGLGLYLDRDGDRRLDEYERTRPLASGSH